MSVTQLDKKRQKTLFTWLKQQSLTHKKKLRLSVLAGFASAVGIVVQAALLTLILQELIINQGTFGSVFYYFIALLLIFVVRAGIAFAREQINYQLGALVRQSIRHQLLNKVDQGGPAFLNGNTTGGLSTLLIEQIEDLQDFYAHYLPQMRLAMMIPILVFIVILPFNWAAALILLCTAPLIPIFMILVGMGAADVNRKNFKALSYLSGHFLDRLKGLQTIRLFNQGEAQTAQIKHSAENFRVKTMNVLKIAFLSSAVLEFFTSISIAVVAVYFGFSYLGVLHFGSYNAPVTLFAGFFALILAPEFFQPLRDLGTYYHAKAKAVAAADNLEKWSEQGERQEAKSDTIIFNEPITKIIATNLVILSPDNKPIVGPLSFELLAPFNIALVGVSGEGKSSLINGLLGFLPYQGSLKINDFELSMINIDSWRAQLSWVGQMPYLIDGSIKENIILAKPNASDDEINAVIKKAQLDTFLSALPEGENTPIGEDALKISLGQAQRIAIARALIKPHQLFLLDEPLASLDKQTAIEIENILNDVINDKNQITITHQSNDLSQFSQIWQLKDNQLTLLNQVDKTLC